MQPTEWHYLAALTPETIGATLQHFQNHRLSGVEVGIFALVCEQECGATALLQEAANAVRLPLVGAVVPGLLVEAKFCRQGALLIAFAATTPQRLFRFSYHEQHTTDQAIESLSDFIAEHADENGADTLLLLVDAKLPNMTSVLDRLYLEIGDQVNYVGTCVGSETFQPMPCLFDNRRFIEAGIFALVLRQHPGAALAHHYRGNESLWVATATAGSYIKTIGGQPAFEVYQRLMESEYGIDLDRENFYRHAVHFPFALNRAHGESIVRIPVLVEEDGAVYCSGEVPENALLSVVRAVAPGSLETVHALGAWMRPHTARGVLTFYCAGRLMHLGVEAGLTELAALTNELAPMPLFGALSLGEIGSGQRHYPAFHNAMIVALPWI
ncbi:putative FIST C domain protein [Candidatus Competibacter denitrificans Run_A_D11]|uniref:FIST C domain protein n=1 Tax=Candidatus Competibacter denitrificans Run_A_D11 TaxID=1400863 RepID=W6M0I8_9GAMM|nr:FIST C-terminal domain-containing protein [Candidatus Competibacter denitrificans]CDI00871.1 putative FIST C domain protein [Candidatus Competibacter denitrificans Run_A_D11]HRC69329.1 FIST C-terminal domain-containing protein [Candidatus Competibacter denitrificans]